ncbi:hypothetical protein [Mitsuaria sp. GD03876]|uniref:hypothetical protein n=1 Tax=Mitsuaria sp. GD03876 TaxID=2975399 RepID=UPI00244A76CF|nr:hypothetical protein [Mitsuaria sp. GD03876]MDH0866471.1 hypothetical protein [Mitsuaria sp. GD03876]
MNSDPKQRLYSRAVLDASNSYAARVRELRAMRLSLDLFEPDLAALEKRRIAPQPEQIRWIPLPASLSIHMGCRDDANRLHAALLELGYTEVFREDFVGGISLVAVAKGAVRISVSVYRPRDAA